MNLVDSSPDFTPTRYFCIILSSVGKPPMILIRPKYLIFPFIPTSLGILALTEASSTNSQTQHYTPKKPQASTVDGSI